MAKARTRKTEVSSAVTREFRGWLRDLVQLVRPDPTRSLELLCRAWRKHPCVRLAELAELVEHRVPEQPAAGLAEAIKNRRVAALRPAVRSIANGSAVDAAARLRRVVWRDPRLPWILLELLAKPHWRSLPAVACWQACLDLIVEAADPRIIEPLAELGERYTAVIPTSVGLKVQSRIRAAVEKLRAAKPYKELDAECLALCDQILGKLGPEVEARRSSRERQHADHERHAEFLAAIVDAPDDDAPRIVYADWLMEQGDPRGELINLQLARARGVTDEVSRGRERALLDEQHSQRWLGGIGPVAFDTYSVYARGFCAHARLWKNKEAIHDVAGDAAWGTIEVLSIPDLHGGGDAAIFELVIGPRMRALRALVNFPASMLTRLIGGRLAGIERVERVDIADDDLRGHVRRWLAVATRPRALSFDCTPNDQEPVSPAWLVDLPGFDRLDRIELAGPQVSEKSIARFEHSSLPRLRFHTVHDVSVELSRSAGAAFDRARIWRQIPRSWLEGPRGVLDVADAFDDIAPWIRDRVVVVDLREPFLPGSTLARHPVRAKPSDALLARIREISREVTIETGWFDGLPELVRH